MRVASIFILLWSLGANAVSLECGTIFRIQAQFFANHINYKGSKSITPAEISKVEARVREQYIKTLDRSKLYLLDTDVKAIEAKMADSLRKVQAGKCDFLFEIDRLLGERVKDRVDFAKSYLESKSFKFDPKTELLLDPDKRSFAKTKTELDEFHKKYLQFQLATYLQTGSKIAEAKANTIKRYERAFKRYDKSAKKTSTAEGDDTKASGMTEEEKNNELYDQYLNAFARSLDPHSNFLSQDMLEDFEIQMRLSLEGIGATLSSQDGFTVIEQLIPGGAAAVSGKLQPKDKITAVGQGETGKFDNVIDLDLRDVVKKIRGQKGSKVRLKILRKNATEQKNFEVTLIRDKINLEDEAASITYIDKEMGGVKKKIALLNLPSFYSGPISDSPFGEVRSSAMDMKKLLAEAKSKQADAVVLDLSTNGGGSLDDAVNIAGLFFKTGGVVKETGPEGAKIRADSDATVDWSGPLVVLISRISASASEIVAGTLKDYNRAVLVGGDHTFGKGTIQQVSKLPAKLGATKITVGMFFIPGGSTTQHSGVITDIPMPSIFSSDEVGEKTLDYSLAPRTTEQFIAPEAFVTEGSSKWDKITPEVIKELGTRAQARMTVDPEFKKIRDEVKKAREMEKNKITKVSEIMKEKSEADSKEEKKKGRYGNKDEKMAEYLKRADVKEAINVAFDLSQKLSGQSLILTDATASDKSAQIKTGGESNQQ